jgi:uncharacterized protein YaiL (DUF2058 family)
MGDLREEFLKAGLIDEQTAEKVARKRRGSRQQPTNCARASRTQTVDHTKDSTVGSEEGIRDQCSDPSRDGLTMTRSLLRTGRVKSVSGKCRFYFVDRKGRIPFLELNESAVRGLTNGSLAIVESEDDAKEEHVVVTAATARQLHEIDGELVRFWNQSE